MVRNMSVAGAALALFISGLVDAQAADRASCEQYARAALVQVKLGLANHGCAGGLQGTRWSPDYNVHFDWCLGVSFQATGAERDARTAYLKACRGQ
ncbi:MAG TPA: hypothetical protein VLL30_16965 [Reyranella sp.]|jgi:hypothetical protein|nr:hypothetical protein [Reyranella sp.]